MSCVMLLGFYLCSCVSCVCLRVCPSVMYMSLCGLYICVWCVVSSRLNRAYAPKMCSCADVMEGKGWHGTNRSLPSHLQDGT